MKIFAKRSKKGKASSAEKDVLSEADKQVMELLKMDPSKLNAKQRRMLKRHEERGKTDKTADAATDEVEKEKDGATVEDSKNEKEESTEDSGSDSDGSDADEDNNSSSSDSSDDENEESAPSTDKKAEKTEEKQNEKEEEKNDTTIAETKTDATEEKSSSKSGGALDIDEVKKMLESLNSKQRRKLTRRLEREGDTALEEVRAEAVKLLAEGEKNPATPAAAAAAAKKETPTKKRKRGKPVDLSSMTPEERMRREDQRRKQKEAEERRNLPGYSNKKHKHPLNSERRRANRRKPKWNRKLQPQQPNNGGYQGEVGNGHDTSGYHMRRVTKRED